MNLNNEACHLRVNIDQVLNKLLGNMLVMAAMVPISCISSDSTGLSMEVEKFLVFLILERRLHLDHLFPRTLLCDTFLVSPKSGPMLYPFRGFSLALGLMRVSV